MKSIKIAIIALAAMPVLASAQTSLYIPTAQDHFDINGVGGGGPFDATILNGSMPVATETMYCDSIPQEFSLGQTFNVKVVDLNVAGGPMSLDPWVITQASNEAASFDAANSVTLTQKEIVTAIQGSIWELDGQVSGPLTSGDALAGQFANYLYNDATTIGTYVKGYALFDASGNYSDPSHPSGVNGQSQIGAAPVPEPASMLTLGASLIGLAVRKRRSAK